MTYFFIIGVIKDRITKIYPMYLNGKLWQYHLYFFINFLCDPAHKTCLFEKFIFELEASYSFKITWHLIKQVISLKKNRSLIGKICCLISWSSICIPLILVSASMKMASTSVAVIYNSMRVTFMTNSSYKGKKIDQIGDHLF